MHGDKWWKCKNCAADNKSKTACAICGLRRSYADVAAVDQSPKKGGDGKQGNTVRQHLEEVASKLAAAAAGRDSHQPMDVQTNDLDFKTGKAKLAKLEAALRAMPEDDEDFANERNAITTKIAETKAGMAENKPIGARITSRRGIRRGDRMYRMRVARFGSCACSRPSSARRNLYGQHRRRSQCTVTTALEHPQGAPGSGPQPCVCCHGSLCSAHRGVSTCLRGSGTTARSSSRPAEKVTWEAIPESAPTSATYVSQNEGSQTTSWRSRSRRMRRDFGLTNEMCCFGSTDRSICTMTVATCQPAEAAPEGGN